MSGGPPFTDWGSPHSSGLIPPDWLQQIYAYLIQHPLPVSIGQIQGYAASRVTWGVINSDGTTKEGTGFSSSRAATGRYSVAFSPVFATQPSFLATATNSPTGNTRIVESTGVGAAGASIEIHDENGSFTNVEWSFLAQASSA